MKIEIELFEERIHVSGWAGPLTQVWGSGDTFEEAIEVLKDNIKLSDAHDEIYGVNKYDYNN